MLLPQVKRRAMYALYAFSRHTDDLGDCVGSVVERRAALAAWRREFSASLEGEYSHPLLPAVADTIERFQIPTRYLYELIDGVEMDTGTCRYETFDELRTYCYCVASVVGLACVHIWGFSNPDFHHSAVSCGHAFQLTNILRDLREDAENGRVYLPQEDLNRFAYSEHDLIAGVDDEQFRELMSFEIARAEQLYGEAEHLSALLHSDGRRVYRIMLATYRALLAKIKQRPGEVLRGSVRLNRGRKLLIFGSTLVRLRRDATEHVISSIDSHQAMCLPITRRPT